MGKILFIVNLIIIGLLTSCQQSQPPTPNPCSGVTCQNNGSCNNGLCSCVGGFWGANCEFTSQQKMYAYTDNLSLAWVPCDNSQLNFNYALFISSVSGDLNDDSVKVFFADENSFGPLYCNTPTIGVINGNSLTIAPQNVCAGNQILNFSFTTNDGENGNLTIEYLLSGDSTSITSSQVYCRG